MKKSTLRIICSFLMVNSMWAQNTHKDFNYIIEGNEITITCYKGQDKSVVIPYEIDGYTVTTIGEEAFYNNDTIISVVLPNTVRTIDSYAFANCPLLRYISIPDDMDFIEDTAFEGATSLQLHVELFSTLHLYAENFAIDYKILTSMDEIIEIIESPTEYAMGLGYMLANMELNEVAEVSQAQIPEKKTPPKTKPIYGWYDSFAIFFLETKDSANITLKIALGYDSTEENALYEIKARKIEIEDFIRVYFAHKKSSELTIHFEEFIKDELQNGINDLCSYPIIKDIKFLDFEVW